MSTQPPGYTDTKDAHLKRLRRIEGQVRGLQRMIEQDTYCIDVLTQSHVYLDPDAEWALADRVRLIRQAATARRQSRPEALSVSSPSP